MATIWDLAQASLKKRRQVREEAAKRENPLDRELPLSLHLDGKIEITAALLPESLHTKFPQGAHIVDDFSKTRILGQDTFRVLLIPEEGETPSYLRIVRNGAVAAVRWFAKLDEVFPGSSEEWQFWLDDKEGSIGLQLFQSKNGTLFNRLLEPENPARIQPIKYSERVYLDRYDENETRVIKHSSMLYGRKVEDDICPCDEYLFLSAVEERDGSYVTIDVGVDLDVTTNLKVVY